MVTARFDESELRLSDLPRRDASVSEIVNFAAAFRPAEVWGSRERFSEVGRSVIDQRLSGPAPCSSLLKLRTALAWLAERWRFGERDDLVGEPQSAPPTPASAPEETEATLRAALYRMRRCLIEGAVDDRIIGYAVECVGATIPADGEFKERGLRDALSHEVTGLQRPHVGASCVVACETSLGPLSGWAQDDPPGKFDLAVGVTGEARPHWQTIAEVKWSDHKTLSHSRWDAAKLIGALATRTDHVYLIGGWPVTVWRQAACAALYRQGTVDFLALARLPGEWPSLHRHSQGRVLELPNRLRVTEIASVSVRRLDEQWEVRAVALEPAPGGWTSLTEGLLDAPREASQAGGA